MCAIILLPQHFPLEAWHQTYHPCLLRPHDQVEHLNVTPTCQLEKSWLSAALPSLPQEDEGLGSPGGVGLCQFARNRSSPPLLVSFMLSLRWLRLASLHSLDLSGNERWLHTMLAVDPTSVIISSSCPAGMGCLYTVPVTPSPWISSGGRCSLKDIIRPHDGSRWCLLYPRR